MSNPYSKKDLKDLEIKRDFVVLKPLLVGIKGEEKTVYDKVKVSEVDIDFKQSFIMISKKQVYRTYSVIGLMKEHNRDTKYYIVDLAQLLDIWYNNSTISKSKLLDCDVLIIHGFIAESLAKNKAEALNELISIRKTYQKLTWFFAEKTTADEFDELYPGVSDAFGKTYRSEF